MTNAAPFTQVDVDASATQQTFVPYAQLAKMLLPSAGSVCVYQENGELRWSSEGYERPDLREIVDGLGGAGHGRSAAVRTTDGGETAFGARLEDEQGHLLGYLVIELPGNRERSQTLATNLLNPLVECLSSRLKADQRVGAQSEATAIRQQRLEGSELDLLIGVSEIDSAGPDALRRLLEHSIQSLDCKAAAFVAPDPSLTCIVQKNACDLDTNGDVIDKTRRHLLAWAQLNNRPMIVNKVSDATGTAPYKILSCPVRADAENVAGLIALFRSADGQNFDRRDVDLLEFLCRRAVRLLQKSVDPLTGLVGRDAFDAALESVSIDSESESGAVLQLTIDRLQAVNDAYGLETGDEVIRAVSRCIVETAPDTAVSCRLSGDRFAVFLPDADEPSATASAQQILARVAEQPVCAGGEPVPVSISAGIAMQRAGVGTPSELIAASGAAAAESRRAGGNRFLIYSDSSANSPGAAQELIAAAQLRRALSSSQFELMVQPIVSLSAEPKRVGFEVLIRLLDDTGARVAPDRFMAVARRYGLALGVDTWVFSELMRQLQQADELLFDLPVGIAVNVSEQSLLSPNYAQTVVTEIAASKLPGSLFSFEIAEMAAVGHPDAAEAFIDRVRATGARVALDGFGSGMTSFAQLRRLRVDYLKVSGDLIRGMSDDAHLESMVKGLGRVADSLNLPTVAEQVENEALAARLRDMGFDYGQGFALGKPGPVAGILGEDAAPKTL